MLFKFDLLMVCFFFKGGSTVIAFVEDPDGYKIELIEEKDAGKGLGN